MIGRRDDWARHIAVGSHRCSLSNAWLPLFGSVNWPVEHHSMPDIGHHALEYVSAVGEEQCNGTLLELDTRHISKDSVIELAKRRRRRARHPLKAP